MPLPQLVRGLTTRFEKCVARYANESADKQIDMQLAVRESLEYIIGRCTEDFPTVKYPYKRDMMEALTHLKDCLRMVRERRGRTESLRRLR